MNIQIEFLFMSIIIHLLKYDRFNGNMGKNVIFRPTIEMIQV